MNFLYQQNVINGNYNFYIYNKCRDSIEQVKLDNPRYFIIMEIEWEKNF